MENHDHPRPELDTEHRQRVYEYQLRKKKKNFMWIDTILCGKKERIPPLSVWIVHLRKTREWNRWNVITVKRKRNNSWNDNDTSENFWEVAGFGHTRQTQTKPGAPTWGWSRPKIDPRKFPSILVSPKYFNAKFSVSHTCC